MTNELPLGYYVKRLLAIAYMLGDERYHLDRFVRLGATATAD